MNAPHDNRARILDAAERLFATRGFSATSVREIVREAGVTNPMLYYYFGSKEDLFVHLLRERFADFQIEAEASVRDASTLHEVLLEWTRAVYAGTRAYPMSLRLVFASVFGPHEGMPMDVVMSENCRVGSVLDHHIRRVEPDVDPDRLNFALFFYRGALNNLIYMSLEGVALHNEAATFEAIVRQIVHIVHDDAPIPMLPRIPGIDP